MSRRVHIAVIGEKDLPRPISPAWELVHVLTAAAAALLAWVLMPQMHDRVPVHFDLAGNPNGWIDKGPAVVLVPVATIAVLAVCLTLVHVGITRSKRAVSHGAPAASAYGYAVFARAQSVALVVLGLLIDAFFMAMPLFMVGILAPNAYLALAVGTCALVGVGAIWMAVRYGSNGRRVAERIAGKKIVLANVDDGSLWRWGGLYHNPDDPSILVPKRYGIGWTINAARPAAWALLLGTIAMAIGFAVAVSVLS